MHMHIHIDLQRWPTKCVTLCVEFTTMLQVLRAGARRSRRAGSGGHLCSPGRPPGHPQQQNFADGFPLWIINKSTPTHAFPWPLRGDCSRPWGENAFSEAASQAYARPQLLALKNCNTLRSYQDFYDNHAGMRDAFVKFWVHSAQLWRDCDSVLGFELMNEPFAGAVLRYPDLLLPGVAGARNLQPLYDAVGAGVRQVNQKHIIFYEPVDWGMVLEGRCAVVRLVLQPLLCIKRRLCYRYVGTGLTTLPGGAQWGNLSCMSYHYYCASFGGRRSVCDGVVSPDMFHAMKDEVTEIHLHVTRHTSHITRHTSHVTRHTSHDTSHT